MSKFFGLMALSIAIVVLGAAFCCAMNPNIPFMGVSILFSGFVCPFCIAIALMAIYFKEKDMVVPVGCVGIVHALFFCSLYVSALMRG